MESNETGYEPRLGLRRVAPVKGGIDNTTLDIIAIHGLDTESPQTWTYKKNGSQAVNWLEDSDMLQAAVPNARIYTYNWNAKVFDDAPVQRLLGHADTLLSLVAGEQGSNSRPIIFIASCFGGLILAEAMNRAGQKDSPYQHILMNTAGMVFLATPFRGSDAAKPANWCVVVGGIMGKRTSEQLVEDLNKKDKELRKLTQLFAELIHHDTIKLPVHCFYETYKTKILRKWFPSKLVAILPPILSNRTELLLVTEDSACLDGVRRYPLNGDHSMMNKFYGPESANYQQVRNVIKEIAHNAFKTTEYQRFTQGRYIYQETPEDMRQDELHTRLQVDLIVSHLESRPRIEDIQAVVGNISGGLWKYARTRSEIPNADDHVRSPLVPTNSTFEVDIPNRIARLSYPTRSPVLRATDDSSELARDFDGLRCKCKEGRSLRIWNRGLLGFKVETQGTRRCPVHGQRSSTSYTIEAKLSPWINKTLELALLLNSGKVFGISPSFKFRGTVKRSESAMFQPFDRFVDKCLIINPYCDERYGEDNMPLTRVNEVNTLYWARWDEKVSTGAMLVLVWEIEAAIRYGKASGDDSDENGNTLLTEISYVAGLMHHHFRSVAPQMHKLLQFAQASKIDPMVAVSPRTRKYKVFNMADKPVTAMSYLYSATILSMRSSRHDISALRALKAYEGAFESLVEYGPRFFRVEKLTILQADPELAEGLNYPNLHLAIIRRSISALKSYFHPDWSELLDSRYLVPVELALGWTEGLQFLVDQGCHIGWAFQTACHMNDVESASILLSSSRDIFSVQYSRRITSLKGYTRDLLEVASVWDANMFRLVAKELWQRRDELRRFSIAHSNFKQQLVDNFFGSLELDESTHDRLAEIPDLPDRLKCWDIGSPHCPETLDRCRIGFEAYKILHDVGFVDMQALCRHGMTPLAECCLIFERHVYLGKAWFNFAAWFDLAAWFAGKGADPDFSHANQGKLHWPHLQFYVALATDHTNDGDNEIYGIKKSTLTTDTCRCSCSSKGCIPPFLLWSCSLTQRGAHHKYCKLRILFRERKLKYWMKLCGFKRRDQEKSYKELCRRELFDRLGMRHTCCAALEVQTTQEKDWLSSEDASARNELLWLVRIYAITRKLFPDATVSQFWKLWWNVADDVLLPLFPEEACRCPWWTRYENSVYCSEEKLKEIKKQVEQRRLDRWLAWRGEAGYEGWDDNQVFKFHFTRFWLLAKAHRQRLASWKRHRLMVKPRFILTKRGGMADVYMSY